MEPASPAILEVELAASSATARLVRWSSADRVVDAVGRCGGSALALAIVSAAQAAGETEMPLVLAAGEAVARGLPTAARACVASRAPLSGTYADGHVGGALGPHLAAIALAIRGRVEGADAVLVVGADGNVRLERVAGLEAHDVLRRARVLRETFRGAALLVAGPAGDAGIPFATLANEAEPPSFVGRGGLGAVLGARGLRAIAVLPPRERRRSAANDREHDASSHATLLGSRTAKGERRADPRPSVLLESVRLLARAAGGTFESRVAGSGADPDDPGGRKGCRGCPTPCGWIFERASGSVGARRGSLEALGAALGLTRFEDALALLARCDELGLDAKEAGAALALLVARPDGDERAQRIEGDVGALLAVLDEVPSRVGLGARIAGGAARLARELGLEAPLVRGQAARAESDLASLLGQCVSTRGADPMRTFAFLAADVPDRARLERLLAPWSLPERAEDPRDPAGKGRLVAWTESFLAAVDASGFCAFSAAALLADGVLDLDALARWIAPEAARADDGEDGLALLAAGASIAIVQRDLARSFGARGADDRPAFAAAALDRAGMLDEYRRFRGLDSDGAPTREARRAAGTRAVLDLHGESAPAPRSVARAAIDPALRVPGRVVLCASGPLGARLGSPRTVELDLPASLVDVLEAAAVAEPSARPWLVRAGTALPVAARGRERVASDGIVRDGDRIDLVIALSGG